jgi:IclR family transcriptional regulator, mhp operon transcriptional activator
MKADQELRSLKRGLKVLQLLNQIETVGISELARRLELPRTTAERILLTLAAEGYVERIPNDKRYRLSAKVCTLARGFSEDNWIVHVATPLLFELTKRIGWPLGIATPVGENMVLRVTTDPATSLWLHRRRIGAETPMLRSSAGLVAMAFAPQAEREALTRLLQSSKNAHNRAGAADPQVLAAALDPVRKNGYAFQPPPTNAPERSISVPIFINGECEAVLLMMYMTRALKTPVVLRDYLPLLQGLASRIGERVRRHDDVDPEPDELDFDLPASVSAFGAQSVRVQS